MEVRIVLGKILECDMKSAGPSIFRELGYISEKVYLDLIESDKLTRNIVLGKAMINTTIDDIEASKLKDTYLKKYVNMFITENKLKPENILEIASDAVFVYKATPKVTTFGDYIRFRCKERYFGMIEFPISETNNNKIKIYKRFSGINIRGARFNEEHPSYYTLQILINSIIDKDSKKYFKTLRLFIKELKGTDNLINSVDNTHLINVFKAVAV